MDQRNPPTTFAELFRHNWRKPYLRWGLLGGYALLGALAIYWISIPDLVIFPQPDRFAYFGYGDGSNGGNSRILSQSFSDSSLTVHFELKPGFVSPYAGLTFHPLHLGTIDASPYHELEMVAQVEGLRGMVLSLFTAHHLPADSTVEPEVILQSMVEMMPDQRRYRIPLAQMKIPDWWYHHNKLSSSETIPADLHRVWRLNVGTINNQTMDGQKSVTIYTLAFRRNNTNALLALAVAALLLPGVIIAAFAFYDRLFVRPQAVTVEYKSVTLPKTQPVDFMNYLHQHFHEAELTLEQMALEVGISERRIAQHIQENFNCNFKTYLNRLRIAESKRLLTTTQLNIGEIAYKVGFSNQSHFNRVFKSQENLSPTQFREQLT